VPLVCYLVVIGFGRFSPAKEAWDA
jgi:hypothetical protein